MLAFPVCSHLLSTKLYTVYKCWRVLAFSPYWLLDACIINLLFSLEILAGHENETLPWAVSLKFCWAVFLQGGLVWWGVFGEGLLLLSSWWKNCKCYLWHYVCLRNQPYPPKECSATFSIREHSIKNNGFYYFFLFYLLMVISITCMVKKKKIGEFLLCLSRLKIWHCLCAAQVRSQPRTVG